MSEVTPEEVVKKGICSMESIEQIKKIAENLDQEPARNEILEAERLLKAISDRTRIKLLLLLSRGEMCVCQIAAVSELKQPAISSSLRLMEKAGLLKREQRGKWHYYSLTDNDAIPLLLKLIGRRR
jgi:ArsR family transcriptional regulator